MHLKEVIQSKELNRQHPGRAQGELSAFNQKRTYPTKASQLTVLHVSLCRTTVAD